MSNNFLTFIAPALLSLLISCSLKNNTNKPIADNIAVTTLRRSAFQSTVDGTFTDLFILKNKNRSQAMLTNYGGRIVGLWVPDKHGKLTDIVAGL